MAITLTIELTDQEQARVLEIAGIVAPELSPAQVKVWAEKKAKAGLRNSIATAWREHQQTSMETDWPEDLPEVPPQS